MVIQSGIQVGKSNRSIATCLGRTHSVINYEIKQNSGTRERYTAKTAECLFKERRNKKRKRNKGKSQGYSQKTFLEKYSREHTEFNRL